MIHRPYLERRGLQIAVALQASSQIEGDDEVDTLLLNKMLEDASSYLSRHSWCASIKQAYFAGGVGGILAIFFFHIDSSRQDVDPWIWVIVGDIPPAYLPLSDCESQAEAYALYTKGMMRWAEIVRAGDDPSRHDNTPPVNVPASREWADRLSQRLHALSFTVAPFFTESEEVDLAQ
jgi:hypothetical protein